MLITENANYRHRFPIVTVLLIITMGLILGFGNVIDLAFVPSQEISLSVIASIFTHSSIVHYIVNMLYLYIFGDNVEDVAGHALYLIIFIVLGVIANLLYMLIHLNSDHPVVGASGAISGILGMYYVLFPNVKTSFYIKWASIEEIPASISLLLWFGIQLMMSALELYLLNGLGIAFTAHISGFLVGMLFGYIFLKLGFLDRHEERIRQSSSSSLTVICPSCNTPKNVKKYGKYFCLACKSEFYFDKYGKKLL
ncbi:rhomboid family intramembrane serine protease [Leptospira sarikeiensis]|uniref:Rhomboid family intramembrane serine protease n=1 Tax=Leptospira sarikeiensis TaxID=2484943 RepID=A0A4R9KCM9_9LEPT|nr:rhomboid family intramembrane serine protease [Leptospira sarikeiensis]TGL64703.1 rhomboid family intramembrane serine protease [Leptospira sarikeiensis]